VPNYNEIIATFQAELSSLLDQRAQLERHISGIMNVIDAMLVLAEESNQPTIPPPPLMMDSETGFTDRVRAILKANPAKPLTPMQVRDVLSQSAPQDDPKILLIHTHNTLKRLLKQREVEETFTSEGRAYRRTLSPNYGILSALGGAPTDKDKMSADLEDLIRKRAASTEARLNAIKDQIPADQQAEHKRRMATLKAMQKRGGD